jgi:hypothetical protein
LTESRTRVVVLCRSKSRVALYDAVGQHSLALHHRRVEWQVAAIRVERAGHDGSHSEYSP